MRGLVCQPWFCMFVINGSYLIWFCVKAKSGNLSWQYVNSTSWTVILGEDIIGVCAWLGVPIMHRTSRLSLAWHWHVVSVHVHLRSYSRIVWSGGVLFRCSTLASVKNWVFLWACNVCVMRCTALLCFAVLSPFKYGSTHVERRCGHVSLLFVGIMCN